MVVKLRKMAVYIALTLGLVTSLISGTMYMKALSPLQHNLQTHSSQILADDPNHVCPVCLGMPGTLPVINAEAVRKTLLTGLALNCTIPPLSKFDRKNYPYPDLMKGYQISEYDMPICVNGYIDVPAQRSDDGSQGSSSAHRAVQAFARARERRWHRLRFQQSRAVARRCWLPAAGSRFASTASSAVSFQN